MRHRLSQPSSPSASKSKNIQCPTPDIVSAIRALAKFTFSGMVGGEEGPLVTIETSMTKADYRKKMLGASGAIMLAAFLPKCQ